MSDQLVRQRDRKLSGVYALLAKNGEGVYVGSSYHIDQRIRAHFHSLDDGVHHAKALQRSYAAGERFDVVVLEQCAPDLCVEREQYWMDRMGPLLNTSPFAIPGHSNRGQARPSTSETNRKRTGTPWRPRDREAWIRNLSATKTGQKFGPRDPSVGQKIAASLRGQPMSEERRKKISLGRLRFHAQLRAQGLIQRRPRRKK